MGAYLANDVISVLESCMCVIMEKIITCVVMLDNTLSRTLVSGSEMTRVVSGAIESTFVSSNKFIIKLDFIINLQPIKNTNSFYIFDLNLECI